MFRLGDDDIESPYNKFLDKILDKIWDFRRNVLLTKLLVRVNS